MKFKIIPNEQTPEIALYNDIQQQEVIPFIEENYLLLSKFLSFARTKKNCVGLAANQVSVDGNRIMKPFFAIKEGSFWNLILFPKIIEGYGLPKEEIETCLTWIGKKIKATRHPGISVSYYTLKGEYIETLIKNFEAQIWQHEYNHLKGINEIFI